MGREGLRARLSAAATMIGAAFAMLASTAAAEDWARYRIDVDLNWRAAPDEAAFPDDPHFSRLIGAAHRGRYVLFADGATASTGLGLVATNGRIGVLLAELAEAARRGRVGQVFEAPALRSGVGRITLEARVTGDHPLVSFATMLAPSPDWFTGVSGVDLRAEASEPGAWVETATAPLWVWDAGVDGGAGYEAANAPLRVRESVRLAAGRVFLRPDGLRPIGRVLFTRIATGVESR